ncbi:RagB/SusD family nutrient uptake outer membrane protein [Chitinophaga sp. SYP-B3965]|uniref:RagB/SusD family nutrient uptake outer membrane protein n=1 Tax=Chitinophaga sp. SYP-B3965 TaxID=2663120 RepID=UPI001299B80C|nr:RagB/SusD family nutrient uptake outer membrane protein [Chitinophaga sp. SYP-B3965]MRG49017.1 RagB/SusD family nutrient uptake outer membrane protein [Chitinophaga sp. SYP-B3965]
MNRYRYYSVIAVAIVLIPLMSCDKEFLEKRPNSTITIPSTLEDFQKLLDVDSYMRETPAFGDLSSDDYYIKYDNWNGLKKIHEKNCYIWNKEIYNGVEKISDWNLPYQQVFYANVVLEGLANIEVNASNQSFYNNIKGSALFIRAFAFYNLAQAYSPMYDESAASNMYGIPLRLTAGIDDKTERSTVKVTYDRIINDLIEAKNLLQVQVPELNRNRPSKPAATALLARAFLSMRDYKMAGQYADSTLAIYNKLIDYNTISLSSTNPFTKFNVESIYQSCVLSESTVIASLRVTAGFFVDTTILSSYVANDLRKQIYYTAAGNLKGSYNERVRFSGFATDEVYLIRAECYARAGKVTEAMKDLNDLLKTRWRKVSGQTTFVDYVATDGADALRQVLVERRKELILRGLRWSDLRRLNKEGANITLKRILNGVTYTLPPNDPRYVAPIPNDVIAFSGIEQNIR